MLSVLGKILNFAFEHRLVCTQEARFSGGISGCWTACMPCNPLKMLDFQLKSLHFGWQARADLKPLHVGLPGLAEGVSHFNFFALRRSKSQTTECGGIAEIVLR